MNCLSLLVLLIVGGIPLAGAKTINNTLTGQPIVRCGPDSIAIQAVTESAFQGVVYIKNWRANDLCVTDYTDRNPNNKLSSFPGLSVALDEISRCGIEMRRNPASRELELFTVFVFSFHSDLITMGDRAFAVHCTFRQRDITVATRFDLVSDLGVPVQSLGATASMPSVVMKVVAGEVADVQLPAVTTVGVGEPLTFLWHLPIAADVYGIRVKDCRAETLKGRRAPLLESGCSRDRETIGDVQYTTDQMTAYARTMAFKFPDEQDLWFKCSIIVCVKKMPGELTSVEHTCREVETCTKRKKRDLVGQTGSSLQLDNAASADTSIIDMRLRVVDTFTRNSSETTESRRAAEASQRSAWQVCMGRSAMALTSSSLLLVYLTTAVLGCLGVVARYGTRHTTADARRHSTSSSYSDFFVCRS